MNYSFCLHCGAEFEKQNEDLFVCVACGFHLFINPRASNALIVENKKHEILLVKRKLPPKKDFWDLPGGVIALHESAEESVRREIKEELNSEVKEFKYFKSYPESYKYKGDTLHMLPLIFIGTLDSDIFQVGDDVSGYKFFSKKEIPFENLAFPVLNEALTDYLSSFPDIDSTENHQ